VHIGTAPAIQKKRQAVLDAACAADPRRFTRRPRAPELPAAAWINKPVNVRRTLLTVQKAVPLMTAGGLVIVNGSVSAVKGVPGATVYAAAKAALRSFVRSWTAELSPRGIRVNLLSAGPVDTAAWDSTLAEVQAGIRAMIPAGRFGTPEEIAAAALFLASGDSSFSYGSELAVDGGTAQV
jgi:NAD(P)-dependent dehydrogenase (short-subunit alcohol dehydrogenase family)